MARHTAKSHKIRKVEILVIQITIYRFPTCPFFIDLVNALKCLILQALMAFSVREETIVTYRKMV